MELQKVFITPCTILTDMIHLKRQNHACRQPRCPWYTEAHASKLGTCPVCYTYVMKHIPVLFIHLKMASSQPEWAQSVFS